MLDLLLAKKEERLECVSNVCAAAPVPSSTALRWIKKLEREGILIRHPDPDDRRCFLITLSEDYAGRVDAALLQAHRALRHS